MLHTRSHIRFELISNQLRDMQGQMVNFAEQLNAVQANRTAKTVITDRSVTDGSNLDTETISERLDHSMLPTVVDNTQTTLGVASHGRDKQNVNTEGLDECSREADWDPADAIPRSFDNQNSNNRVRRVRFGDEQYSPVNYTQDLPVLPSEYRHYNSDFPEYEGRDGVDMPQHGADESLARLQRGSYDESLIRFQRGRADEPLARFQHVTADEPLARFQRATADEPLARFQRGTADEPLARFQRGTADEPLARFQQRRTDGTSTRLQHVQDNDYIAAPRHGERDGTLASCQVPAGAYTGARDGMEDYMRERAPQSESLGSNRTQNNHGNSYGAMPGAGVYSNSNGYLPSVSGFRNDQRINDAVNSRLVQLGLDDSDHSSESAKKKGKKSGISRTVEDQVLREIDWPHLYVYRGQDRKPATYNDLTLAEFIFGYISMINNPRNMLDKELMLHILRNMMLDTTQYGWVQVRNFYRILASGIEMARYDWGDSGEIAALRSQYAQRPNLQIQNKVVNRQPGSGNTVKVCNQYQNDECVHIDTHEGLLHICAYCYNVTGMYFKHKEKECRRKSTQSKNGLRGGN